MLEFLSFDFENDFFYQKKTIVPLDHTGITFLRGRNFDASPEGDASNGTGKSRLLQIFEGFLFGKNPRGNFKKVVLPNFVGTLKFKIKNDIWSFTYTPNKNVDAWSISKNDIPFKVSHKPSDCLEFLQKTIGLSRDDYNHFISINQSSLDVLIKGAPRFRKEYLENFFRIDTFYAEKFNIYNTKWKSIKDEIESIKNDRIRLDSILKTKDELPGEKWIEFQLENCDTALSLIKDSISETTTSQASLQKQIDAWNQYHSLFTDIQGLDIDQIRSEQDTLIKVKVELERKLNNRKLLDNFLKVKFHPHQNKKPKRTVEKPESERPDSEVITEKEVSLNQMKEKLRLKKQVTSLNKEIEELGSQVISSREDLDSTKAELYKQRTEKEDHCKLLKKGGTICPTCRQPLSHILDGQTPEAKLVSIEEEIKDIVKKEKEIQGQITLNTKLDKLNQELNILKVQFDRFPTYGVKLSNVELEVAQLKALALKWNAYLKEEEQETKWSSTYELLLAEAKNLGYPTILNEDVQGELDALAPKLFVLVNQIKMFDRFEHLAEVVIKLLSLTELELQKKDTVDELAHFLSKVESLNEFKGVLRTQLATLVNLKAQIESLEVKVAKQEATESECKILELLNNFYSPTGFKVYELKKRCQKLIERANIWSSLFFQEKYVWSLSEEPDGLDFLIKPLITSDVPYSVSLLSTGEYNRAARVLLFSQLELIPPNKNTNLLILDEIEGHLDEAGMTAFIEVVLPKLRETFPDKAILIISHLPSLQQAGVIDHLWLATRKNRKTTLEVFQNYKERKYA
jgi:hypothetical protein